MGMEEGTLGDEGTGTTQTPGTGVTKHFALVQHASGDWYVQSRDEVLVVALDARGAVTLIVEPSPAFDGEVLVLPGGTVDPGEALEATANRELREEVGMRAERVQPLGELRAWSKYLSVRSHVFLARDLVPDPLPGDEPYVIRPERTPLDAFEALIASGRLRDARVIAALYLARRALAAEAISETGNDEGART
jgi:ADP-ribose diphosphatase